MLDLKLNTYFLSPQMYCSKCIKTRNYVQIKALIFTCPCGLKWCNMDCRDSDEHALICAVKIHKRVQKLFALINSGYVCTGDRSVTRVLTLEKDKKEYVFELYSEGQSKCLFCGKSQKKFRRSWLNQYGLVRTSIGLAACDQCSGDLCRQTIMPIHNCKISSAIKQHKVKYWFYKWCLYGYVPVDIFRYICSMISPHVCS